ncbi:MAG TPA: NAD-dependent epimerase/dehydratase family protein [Thermoleophilaceae bacterium]|nr:NAD-dependent epimerase/dehydratase family protein [Thermoleophilaceae bacterium]
MRVFLTGGTGFIGGRVAAKLRERGDEVVALVRSPNKAATLRDAGCELVEGDLTDLAAIRRGLEGADACIHAAAVYKVGIPKKERAAMHESNVTGTENVLDAAIEAGASRILYVSTVAVFGNTKEEIVDERYKRNESEGFLSCYDETKYRSHQIAKDRIEGGAPIVIVQPGGVYGPGDHSEVGNFIEQTRTGKLRAKAFPELGLSLVYVDDVADGILLALEKGKTGESYVLGGEIARMDDVITKTAELSGRKPPRATLPVPLMKLSAPLGPVLGPIMGFPPNFTEAIRTSDGVTFWARHDKATRELGYSPRDLETGLRQTLDAAA